MKKFIAFNGGSHSGIQTYEKALEWAKKELGNKHGLAQIYLTEIVRVVERVEPPIRVISFEPETTDMEKAA